MTSLLAQMNFQDSSVQVISYWDIGEQYEYEVSLQELQYTETDTLANFTINYEVDVSVLDSTSNSYLVRWHYKNFSMDVTHSLVEELASLTEEVNVDIQTDELGIIKGVKNWKEVSEKMLTTIDSLNRKYGSEPSLKVMLEEARKSYLTKASIEAFCIEDAVQFHHFFGAKYEYGQPLFFETERPNNYYPDNPIDSEFSVALEEMDKENNYYTLRSIEEVNSEQLLATVRKYLNDPTDTTGLKTVINADTIKEGSSTIEILSMIHNYGWLLQSVSWEEVTVNDVTTLKTRTIYMK